MLIAHTPEQAARMADYEYVDPNSMQYQNAVMEDKINRHEKKKIREQEKLGPEGSLFGSSYKTQREYSGIYSPEKLNYSNSKKKGKAVSLRLNAPERGIFEIGDKKH